MIIWYTEIGKPGYLKKKLRKFSGYVECLIEANGKVEVTDLWYNRRASSVLQSGGKSKWHFKPFLMQFYVLKNIYSVYSFSRGA